MIIKVFLLLGAVVQVWCKCTISSDDIRKLSHTLAYQESEHQPLQLLNQDTVENGVILYLICGQNTTTSTCHDTTFQPALKDFGNCKRKTKAEIVSTGTQDKEFKCTIYDISFPYYTAENKKEYLMLYRSCYDTSHQTPVYTTYWAYPAKTRCKRPDETFVSAPPAPTDANQYLNPRNVFKRLQELNVSLKRPRDQDLPSVLFHRGHLVPSAAYQYCSQQVATFNFINVVPQFSNINSGNWKEIEAYVREHLAKPNGTKVTTGAVGVLDLETTKPHKFVSVYLKAPNQLPVPLWTYTKIEGHDIVYLVYNNILIDTDLVQAPKCGIVKCTINLLSEKKFGKTFCCKVDQFDKWLKSEITKM